MEALRLALHFVRIPRLFLTLLFFPLLVGLLIVYVQALLTGLALQGFQRNSTTVEHFFQQQQQFSVGRFLLFGAGEIRPPLEVCRWTEAGDTLGKLYESPPRETCNPDRLDVAVIVKDPATFDASRYVAAFEGNVDRIHLCRSCSPDLVVDARGDTPKTHIKSLWAFVIVNLLANHQELGKQYVAVMKSYDDMISVLGKNYLELPGFPTAIPVAAIVPAMLLILNLASVVVISLWLGLKAHRKVLDYFAYSGVLLPMVAANGRQRFYSAIWVLTFLRVAAFVFGAVPFLILSLADLFKKETVVFALGHSVWTSLVWIAAIAAGMAFATLIGSVADLKHRFHLLSFLYRYVPLVVCVVGASVWSLTFLFEGRVAHLIREITTLLPIVGIAPVLMAPVFKPGAFVLVLHLVLTVLLFIVALKSNARWFAAHLEDI